jgi:hypothetical protein
MRIDHAPILPFLRADRFKAKALDHVEAGAGQRNRVLCKGVPRQSKRNRPLTALTYDIKEIEMEL